MASSRVLILELLSVQDSRTVVASSCGVRGDLVIHAF